MSSSRVCAPSTSAPAVVPRNASRISRPSRASAVVTRAAKGDSSEVMRRAGAAAASVALSVAMLASPAVAEPTVSVRAATIATLPGAPAPPPESKQYQASTKHAQAVPSNSDLLNAVARDNDTPGLDGSIKSAAKQEAAGEARRAVGDVGLVLPSGRQAVLGALPGADFLSSFFRGPSNKGFDEATASNAGPGSTATPKGIESNSGLLDAVRRDNPVFPKPSAAVRDLKDAANEERAAEKVGALSVPGLPAARTGALLDFGSFFNKLKNTRPETKGFDEATASNAGPGNTNNPIGIESNSKLLDAVRRDNPVFPAPSEAVRDLKTAADEERAAEKPRAGDSTSQDEETAALKPAEKVGALSVPGVPAARTGALLDFGSLFQKIKQTRPETKGFDEATASNAGPGNTNNPIGIESNSKLLDAVRRDNPVFPAPSDAVRDLKTAADEERAAEKDGRVGVLSVPGLPAARVGFVDLPTALEKIKNTRPAVKGFDEATASNAGPGNTNNPIGIESNSKLLDAVRRDNPVFPAPSDAVRDLKTAADEERAAEKPRAGDNTSQDEETAALKPAEK